MISINLAIKDMFITMSLKEAEELYKELKVLFCKCKDNPSPFQPYREILQPPYKEEFPWSGGKITYNKIGDTI